MELVPLRDLIKDEYGNYYFVIRSDGETLMLVNAFMEISFRRILPITNDYDDLEKYRGKGLGQKPMDTLKHIISSLDNGKSPGYIYNLDDIKHSYNIKFIPLYERAIGTKN